MIFLSIVYAMRKQFYHKSKQGEEKSLYGRKCSMRISKERGVSKYAAPFYLFCEKNRKILLNIRAFWGDNTQYGLEKSNESIYTTE